MRPVTEISAGLRKLRKDVGVFITDSGLTLLTRSRYYRPSYRQYREMQTYTEIASKKLSCHMNLNPIW